MNFSSLLWYVASLASYAGLTWIFLRLTRPSYLALQRRRSGFGTVFDSQTGKPEALVTVRLRNLHGSIVRTAVTDRQGRYRLTAPKDEYYVEVDKAGFKFPPAILGKQDSYLLYNNLLPSPHIMIREYGTIAKNIPVDPVKSPGGASILTRQFLLGKGVQSALSILCPLLAIGIAYLLQSWLVWLIFMVYVVTLLTRLFSFKPPEPPYGTIRDDQSGYPVAQAVVRLFESKFNKMIETQVTSAKGRYAFVVNRGGYNILIKKDGYKSVMLKFPHVNSDGFLLGKDVRLKSGESEAEVTD